jgi:phosphoglycerate dehydrogenase-like enzyme
MAAEAETATSRYSEAKPFRVHIENETRLMPVFTVYREQYQRALERHADIAPLIRTTWSIDGETFRRDIADADALIGYRFPRENLAERAPKLRFVQVLGAGVDFMLPLDWVPPGLTLTTNCGAHVPKASQSGLMAILMANAQIPKLVTAQRRREWNRIFTTTVSGKTLLIVGVGHIGGGIAHEARRLGMKVLGIRRSRAPHPAVDEMYGPEDLHAALGRADIVMANTALTAGTRFLFGRAEFAAMKRGAAFINMSRGGLVDPKALEEALRTDQLVCALVDVTYPEPLPADASLWEAPNLIITPHVLSDDLDEYVPRTLDIFFENVRRCMRDETLINVVDLERQY